MGKTWEEYMKEVAVQINDCIREANYAYDLEQNDPTAYAAFERARKQEIDALNKQADADMARYVAGLDAGVPGSDRTYVMTCTAVNRDKGEVTYTVSKLEDIVNFEVGRTINWKDVVMSDEDYVIRPLGIVPNIYVSEIARTETVPTDDDGPESYDDLLASCSGWDDEEFDEMNSLDIETAKDAGDETLVRLLREAEEADKRVAMHARAMQAARNHKQLSDAIERDVRAEAQERPGVMIKADTKPGGWQPVTPLQWIPAVQAEDMPKCEMFGIDRSGNGNHAKPVKERTCTTCSKTCDVGAKCWWCGNG